MQSDRSPDIRADQLGQADVDYYLAAAHRMRAQWFSRQLRELKTRLANLLCRPLFGCGGPVASH